MSFAGGIEEEFEFTTLVPLVRHLLDENRLTGKDERTRLLVQAEALAECLEDRAVALALYFEVGRLTGDEDLLHSATTRVLLDHPAGFMHSLVNNLSNLSFLGDRNERWAILRQFVIQVIPDPTDPAIRFIDEGRPTDLEELTKAGWSPASEINPSLDVEIRLQVAWKALDVAREQPLVARVKSLLISDFFRPASRSAKRSWEVSAIKAITYLMEAEPEHAILTLKSVPRLPQWGARYLCREVHKFAPFALESKKNWIGALDCPSRVLPANVEDSIVFRALDLMERPDKIGPQRVHELTNHSDFPGWLIPLLLCESELSDPASAELMKWLASTTDDHIRNLPWMQGQLHLARRLADLVARGKVDRTQAIRCLLALHVQKPDHEVRQELLRALRFLSKPDQIVTLVNFSKLVDQTLVTMLPIGLQRALNRGTYRAIIDGSNVMLGGLDLEAGARPRLERLHSAIEQLRENGFEEFRVYFDEKIKNLLANEQKHRLETMAANDEVIQVRFADPYLLDDYLKNPSNSEVISNDRFRDFSTKAEHRERARRIEAVGLRRRKIWADGPSIIFDPTLDRNATLRKGSDAWSSGPPR